MKEIIIASSNEHKLVEIREILKDYKILSLKDIGFNEEIEETGATFKENAFIKAEAIYNKYKKTVLADDTGLLVNALNGEPGVYSARYAGIDKDYKANNLKLLQNLLDEEDRSAKFETCVAIIFEDGEKQSVFGEVKGKIAYKEIGTNGFGYDPLFICEETNETFGTMSLEEKNKISHRKRAFEKAKEIVNKKFK